MQWCLCASLLFFAPAIWALGLGELQVSSNLGEPLKASVPLIELDKIDPQDVKVRLADSEQYKKNGLSFPVALRLKFKIVSTGVAQPIVKISSIYPIEEPFLTLLVEVSSPIGVLYKTFTFLLDPAPELLVAPVDVEAASTQQTVTKVATQPSPIAVKTEQSQLQPPPPSPPKKKKVRRISPLGQLPSRTVSEAPRAHSSNLPSAAPSKLFGKLSLTLSTSLSISKSDPSASVVAGGEPLSADALQEELIAKEKSLHELNAQINEMQLLISGLQSKLGQNSGSAVPAAMTQGASDVATYAPTTISEVHAVSSITATHSNTTVGNVEPANLATKINVLWKLYQVKVLASIALLLVAFGGLYWYRKRRENQSWSHGPFDDLHEEAAQPISLKQPEPTPIAPPLKQPGPTSVTPPLKQPLKVGEKSIKTPAFQQAKNTPPAVPAEYDFLEEADIYLRFGHDKLAEEVLLEAIKINPNNPHSYLTLLGIFESRGDPQGFAETAKNLKSIGDTTDWHKAMQMGKKLDPTNPLYDE